jgi:hypothetical protein
MFQNKTVNYLFNEAYYDREVSNKLTVPLCIRILLYIYYIGIHNIFIKRIKLRIGYIIT